MDLYSKRKLQTGLPNPKLPKNYLNKVAPPVPVYDKANIFNGMFDEELSKIPRELHQRVSLLVHKNVENRVSEYMSEIRMEVNEQLRSQQ